MVKMFFRSFKRLTGGLRGLPFLFVFSFVFLLIILLPMSCGGRGAGDSLSLLPDDSGGSLLTNSSSDKVRRGVGAGVGGGLDGDDFGGGGILGGGAQGDAMPLEPQDPIDDGQPHSIGPWGPVIATYQVDNGQGQVVTVNQLASSDPFTATYQLEDGTIVVSNEDLYEVVAEEPIDVEPDVIPWTGPDGSEISIFDGEIVLFFTEAATQEDIQGLIDEHNLLVIMSWFEPPDVGQEGNSIAVFQIEYDLDEFATFDEAFAYFNSHPLIDEALPNQYDTWETTYAGETNPNDYYYRQRENSYVNVLGVDSSQRVPLGPSGGTWFSDQYIVVIDDGIWRWHPEFWVAAGPYRYWGKITWVGVNVYHRSYRIGFWYGGPNVYNPNRGTLVTHGTQVAGMLTATATDTRGVASSAPQHAVMPIRLKGYYDRGTGNMKYSEFAWVKAIRTLRFQFAHGKWIGKFRVVNMSFSGKRFPHWWGSRNFKKNISRDLRLNDRLYVAAAGNEHGNVRRYPAAFDNVLGVTGLITNRTGTWFDDYYAGYGSNFRDDGYATYPVSGVFDFREFIDSGYWVGRTTSIGIGSYQYWQDDRYLWYEHFNGTSAATPNVAGLAAILYARRPWVTYRDVWTIIVATRDDSTARGYLAGLVDYDAALEGW